MQKRWLIGLSSGSSQAGVDAALVRVDGVGTGIGLHLEQFLHVPFGRDLRELLRRGTNGLPSLRPLGVLHRVLGETFAGTVRQLVERAKIDAGNVLAVGCSGYTLWHDPDGRYPASVMIGMPAVVAEKTGLTVVSDFRCRDVVVGGQGSSLTAVIDQRLFGSPDENRVVIHLGGSATLLALPADPGAGFRHLVGFQAAPCSLLLDGLMRLLTGGREPFDPGGKHAVQGCCIEPLLDRWLGHPLLQRKPPRHLSPADFGDDFVTQAAQDARALGGNLHDLLCTATHFIARALVHALRTHVAPAPARVLLSGGGVRNGLLWRLLEQQLAPLPLQLIDDFGVPSEARKALAFAGLAALTLDAVPANLPGVTGASGPRLLGSLTPGASGNWARCLAWMATQAAPLQRAAA